jgi:hypothetical protein
MVQARPERGISINIDKKHYTAPITPMTGLQLRDLAQPPIGPTYDLWEEVPGPRDDIKIGDAQEVKLKDGMHFYSAPSTINPGAGDAVA